VSLRRVSGLFTATVFVAVAVCSCVGDVGSFGEDLSGRVDLNDFFLAPPLQPGGPLLLCQRFEVTRREFAGDSSMDAELPMTLVSRQEAQNWAFDRGLRLPSAGEWLHLSSVGESAVVSTSSLAHVGWQNTLELGLGRALPVGVFEKGRTPLGGYDFFGNVWEWTESKDSIGAIACGGSFASWAVGTDLFEQRRLEPKESASDLGFRCVSDAAPFLRDYFRQLGPLTAASERTFREYVRSWKPALRDRLALELLSLGVDKQRAALLSPKTTSLKASR